MFWRICRENTGTGKGRDGIIQVAASLLLNFPVGTGLGTGQCGNTLNPTPIHNHHAIVVRSPLNKLTSTQYKTNKPTTRK